jgi:hypothetical protein
VADFAAGLALARACAALTGAEATGTDAVRFGAPLGQP